MSMQAMLDQCRAIETAADVAEIILSLRTYTPSATPAIAKASLDVDINAGRRCHVCSGELTQEEAIAECFGGGDNVMLAHRGCHLMRIESSPEAVLFAMKIGFWTMMRIQMEEGASWRRDMMKAWVSEFGSRIASTVAAPHVPDWSDLATIDTPEDLVRFARHLYLFERERPKWGHQGREVPPWDETVSWKDYKRHKFMPAYRTLTRLKDRKTLRPASEVLARTGGLCALCGGEISTRKDGGSLRLAKDHIHPFSKGGSDGITNLQPLHYACNGAITSVGPRARSLSASKSAAGSSRSSKRKLQQAAYSNPTAFFPPAAGSLNPPTHGRVQSQLISGSGNFSRHMRHIFVQPEKGAKGVEGRSAAKQRR